MTRVSSRTAPTSASPVGRPTAQQPRAGARDEAGGFGEHLAERYRVLANDEEALEAAKLVVQALPWLNTPQEPLRLVTGGVVARGAARSAGMAAAGRPAVPDRHNLTLHLQIDGDAVDITASAAHRETVELLLAARDELAQVLRERGLTLRRLVAAEGDSEADGPAPSMRTDLALRRSYMEVIA
jgi:hypothetical protein